MHVDVVLVPGELAAAPLEGKTAVVIDVLRATTSIVTALENGAREVVPVAEVEEARRMAAAWEGGPRPLLAGERGAKRPDGFDLGNSPLEFTREVVAGRPIILTTTNGTRALENAVAAEELRVACLRNAAAVAGACRQGGRDVVVVCAGTDGRFSFEDMACAALLAHELEKLGGGIEWGDGAQLVRQWFQSRPSLGASRDGWAGLLGSTFHGRRLLALGFEADLAFCGEPNVSAMAPVFRDGRLVAQAAV